MTTMTTAAIKLRCFLYLSLAATVSVAVENCLEAETSRNFHRRGTNVFTAAAASAAAFPSMHQTSQPTNGVGAVYLSSHAIGEIGVIITEHEEQHWNNFNNNVLFALLVAGLYFFNNNNKQKRRNEETSTLQSLVPLIAVAAAASFGLEGTRIVLLSHPISMFQDLIQWYLIQLEEYPLMTKCITTSFIQFIGDLLAQAVEGYRIQQQQPHPTKGQFQLQKNYDIRRGLSFVADGVFLSAPLMHFLYEWMEEAFPASDSAVAAIFHVLFNDIFIDTFYLFVSFVFVAIAEGHWKDLISLLRKDYVDTVKVSWWSSLGFMPIEFISFRFLPVHFRTLAMNFVDVIWGAIISFTAHRSRNEMMKESN